MPEKPTQRHELSAEKRIPVMVEIKKDPENPVSMYFRPEVSDLFKWLIGTVGVGLFGFWINSNIQTRESERQAKKDTTDIEINKIDADAKVIEAISGKFDTTQIIQYKYLTYLRPYVQTKKLALSMDVPIDQLSKNLHLGKYLRTIDVGNGNANKVTSKQKAVFTSDFKVQSFKLQSDIISDEKAVAPNLLPFKLPMQLLTKFNLYVKSVLQLLWTIMY